MVVPWCPPRGESFLFPCRCWRLGPEGVVPHRVVASPWFFVHFSFTYGRGPAIGPLSGKRCWPLLAGLWSAIAPLMKPWCAEEEVPTAVNLNLYRGWKSGWHSDDEPLFGECAEAKLIVSVSLGSSAVFRWRRQSCSDDEGHLCWFGHGDILVMGQCRTSSCIVRILAGNKNGSTVRSVGSNNTFLPTLCFAQE